ncbi:hypothetical protein OA93_23735 [Flavobacterium sp. KMS]|nr:hypothetical protein OA93_23735 [Flavobacterium sp. KMS]
MEVFSQADVTCYFEKKNRKTKYKIMKKTFYLLFFITLFFSCNSPTEFTIPESLKPADDFSRSFINKVIKGQLESSFSNIEPTVLNEKTKEFITNANKNINGGDLKTVKVVEYNWKTMFSTNSEKFTQYNLGYEYEFENKNILFRTSIIEKNNKFSVVMFNGEILPGKLSELTKFTFENKTFVHYIFLIFAILIPLFIIITLVFMLKSRITTKQKVIWSLVILFICFPKFVIDWNNGQTNFSFLNFSLFGSSFTKPTLYSAWLISFNIPIGALIYWFKRNSYLIAEIEDDETE